MTKTLEHHFALIFILTLNKHVVVTSITTWRGNMHNWNFQGLIIREQKLEHLFCSSKIPISNNSFKIYICQMNLRLPWLCEMYTYITLVFHSIFHFGIKQRGFYPLYIENSL